MARTPLKKKPEPGEVKRGVRAIPIEQASELVTIDLTERERDNLGPVEGKFVRLIGPRDACESAKEKLLAAGAVAVKIDRVAEPLATLQERDALAPEEPARDETVREVANRVVDGSTFDRKEELRGAVDQLLSGAGL